MWAEWRALLLMLLPQRPQHAGVRTPPLRDRLTALAGNHVLTAVISVMCTGLISTWLPMLGQPAAEALLWLHLLLVPAAMTAAMFVPWMPLVSGGRRLLGICVVAGGRAPRRGIGREIDPLACLFARLAFMGRSL